MRKYFQIYRNERKKIEKSRLTEQSQVKRWEVVEDWFARICKNGVGELWRWKNGCLFLLKGIQENKETREREERKIEIDWRKLKRSTNQLLKLLTSLITKLTDGFEISWDAKLLTIMLLF